MSFLFKKKQSEDIDPNYYKRQKAYNTAKEAEREKIAAEKGRADAHKLASQKPFYQKLMGAGTAIMKDLTTGDPSQMFGQTAPKHRVKHRRKRK
jgi:hypothetical protein